MDIRKTFRFRAKTARNMCHNVFAIPMPGKRRWGRRSKADNRQILAVFTLLPYFLGSLPYLCHTFTPTACSCACISRRVRIRASKAVEPLCKQLLKVSVSFGFVAVSFGFVYNSCGIGVVLFLEKRGFGWYNEITKRKRRRAYETGKRSPRRPE